MKIKDLIKELQKFNPDGHVNICMSGVTGMVEDVEPTDASNVSVTLIADEE